MPSWTASCLRTEQATRQRIRASLADWAALALAPQSLQPAAHHALLLRELQAVAEGACDRLMVLMPPGSAKSTYASLNVLLGTLAAMATSVVSYWVGSSAGSARKETQLEQRR